MPAQEDTRSTRASSPNTGGPSLSWRMVRQRLEAAGVLAQTTRAARRTEHIEFAHLAQDSRKVQAGSLFIAVRGVEADGHLFIDKAIEKGARAVVCEVVPERARERYPGIDFVRTTDSRVALAELAAAFYGDPSHALRMVGVTGTNGKTTTVFLVHHLLAALGEATGLISTIEVRTNGAPKTAALTTPGPLELQGMLRTMVKNDCTACAMEVSSHAIDQRRVHGIEYDVGIFTNLTSDHLDYHGTLARYQAAKKQFFDDLSASATALYNADDPAGATMVADTAAEAVSYGMGDGVDIKVELLASELDGLRLRLDGRARTFRLVGRFNAYNLAAAYATGRVLGYGRDEVIDVLTEAPPVPGRFEQITFDDGTIVIIDYAHTADALENILKAVRRTKRKTADLWCIFGCGGNRDTSKRRAMGSIAEHYADHVIVTSDNPRTEEPEAIMNDIRRGMSTPNAAQWIVDRDTAIRAAAEQAAPGDVVLIAGKGHETYQIIGKERHPFDDREKARQYFGARPPRR